MTITRILQSTRALSLCLCCKPVRRFTLRSPSAINCHRTALTILLLMQPIAAYSHPVTEANPSTQNTFQKQNTDCNTSGPHIPSEWSKSERNAWSGICHGNEVNFNKLLDDRLDPIDEPGASKWQNKDRPLTHNFLYYIMTQEPFRAAIPRSGIKISGAYFPVGLNLTGITFDRPLLLSDSLFGDKVLMDSFQTSASLSFSGSRFIGDVYLASAIIIGNLSFDRCALKTVNLQGTKVTGRLSMMSANATEALLLDGITVGQSLSMQDSKPNFVSLAGSNIAEHFIVRSTTFSGPILMTDALIGGSLDARETLQSRKVILERTTVKKDVYLSDSKFSLDVVMDSISIAGSLFMNNDARFTRVHLRRAKIGDDVYMGNAIFSSEVRMGSISIKGNLYMRNSVFANIDLVGGDIGGIIAMEGSKVKGTLNMESVIGSSHVYLANAEVGDINLNYSRISGRLATDGGKIQGPLTMHSSSISGSMSLRNTELDEIQMINVAVDEDLSLNGSKFAKVFYMDSSSIGTDLSLQNAVFATGAYFIYTKVGSSLDASGSVLRNVDLTGTRIEGELRLGSGTWTVKWEPDKQARNVKSGPTILLRNATVRVLQDTRGSWPKSVELEGFTYQYLGGRGVNVADLPQNRRAEWFIDWLARDTSYSPQPYRHLARVLRASGYDSMAEDILFASLERERKEELNPSQFRWWFLSALRIIIGYGHGLGHFLALAWAVAVVLAGTTVLRCWKEFDNDGSRLGFWYSLDMLLPIVRLREQHYDIETRREVRYYFYCHKVIGYVLMFFVIAGLSGLAD